MSRFYKLNNRDEFISFVEKMRDNFDCPEDWENFFGFKLKTDEDGNELETVSKIENFGKVANSICMSIARKFI